MNKLLLLLFFVSLNVTAVENKNLERLNFFPNAKGFGMVKLQNETAELETPEQAVQTKKVNNFTNTLNLAFGYKVHKKIFLGVQGTYERTSENALRYGVALKDRFNSSGIKEPEYFLYSRLFDQNQNHGLLDLYTSVSKSFGAREVGNDEQHQRYNGRDIIRIALSHHPYLSHGKRHGPATGLTKWILGYFIVGKFDYLLSGHDHILSDEGKVGKTRLLLSGTGSDPNEGQSPGFLVLTVNLVNYTSRYEWRKIQ